MTTGFAGRRAYLLVTRYDRRYSHGRWFRLHQEDFCQALGKPPSAKYEHNQTGIKGLSLRDFFELARRHLEPGDILGSAVGCHLQRPADERRLPRQELFDPAIRERRQAAPLYDLMCGAAWKNVTQNMAQDIGGANRGRHIHAKHWRRMALSCGVRERPSSVLYPGCKRVAQDVQPALEEIRNMPAGDHPMLDDFAQEISARCTTILANLHEDRASDDVQGAREEEGPPTVELTPDVRRRREAERKPAVRFSLDPPRSGRSPLIRRSWRVCSGRQIPATAILRCHSRLSYWWIIDNHPHRRNAAPSSCPGEFGTRTTNGFTKGLNPDAERNLASPYGVSPPGHRRLDVLAVPVVFYVGIRLLPTIDAFWLSLNEWNLLSPPHYVGLRNYTRLMHDPVFWKVFGNTVIYLIAGLPISLTLSLAIALLLDRVRFLPGLLQALYFLPFLTTAVAMAWVCTWLYQPAPLGLLNDILSWLGLPQQPFLRSTVEALPSALVRHLGGARFPDHRLPRGTPRHSVEYYEAAEVDGVSRLDLPRHHPSAAATDLPVPGRPRLDRIPSDLRPGLQPRHRRRSRRALSTSHPLGA